MEDPDSGPWGGTIPESMRLPDGKDDISAHLYKKALADGKDARMLPSLSHNTDEQEKYGEDWIRGVYEAYLAQDMDEIGWLLFRDPASPFTGGIGWLSEWSKELEPALQNGPTLIIMDVSYLIDVNVMLSIVSDQNPYRIKSVKPIKKD